MSGLTGLKKVTRLRKYINGEPTQDVKDNTVGTEGYIPDYKDEIDCPVGCNIISDGDGVIKDYVAPAQVFTTTTTTQAVVLTRDWVIENYNQTDTITFQYVDENGVKGEIVVLPDTSANITSTLQPKRVSGPSTFTVEPDGDPYQATVTATSDTITTDDYTIDNSSATTVTYVEFTQAGENTVSRAAIKPGDTVSLSSDTQVNVVNNTGVATATQTSTNITPQSDEYTVTSGEQEEEITIQYRPYLGMTEFATLSPEEEVVIKSQDTPTVVGTGTATIVADGNPTQNEVKSFVPRDVCDQFELFNGTNTQSVISYRDCDFIDRQVSVESGETVYVPSVTEPTIVSGSTGTDISRIDDSTSTSGSAFNVPSINEILNNERLTEIETSSIQQESASNTEEYQTQQTETRQEQTSYDYVCGENYTISGDGKCKDGTVISKWFPKTIKIKTGPNTGTMKFTSYDLGESPIIYIIKEGNTVIFDKCIVQEDEGSFGQAQVVANKALVDNGMSQSDADDYTSGSKRALPNRVSEVVYAPTKTKTEFTITKSTVADFVTMEIYAPLNTCLDYIDFQAHRAYFKLDCV
jgi:hypothetical protein